MAMYGYEWLCRAVYGYVWLCRAVYGYVFIYFYFIILQHTMNYKQNKNDNK